MTRQPPSARIKSCLNTLILDEPFFSSLAMRLEYKEDNTIDTMCTNGTEIRWSPDFVHCLPDMEITAVICHEVLHCAGGHLWRRDGRDPRKWNEACDYVVNEQILQHIAQSSSPVMRLPQGALINPDYNGKSAEEIYAILPPPQENPNSPPPPNPCGEFTDPPEEKNNDDDKKGKDSATPSKTASAAEWKIAITQAIHAQKSSGQGSVPSDLERAIREFVTPSIPWQEHLREFTNQITRDDYSWTVPNSRYAHTGFTLPTLRSEAIGDIFIAIDTSGSVDDKLLALFLSETQSLLDSAKPSSITIVSCDTTIHNVRTYHQGEDLISYTPKGGGGTNFCPVFNYIENHQLEPLALIYFTDGWGTFPPTAPHYPTLWLNWGDGQTYPFGQVIELPSAS